MRIYPGTTVDSEFKALGDLGHTGTLNDRQFSFLRDEGLTLALPDMFAQYTSGGGSPPVVTNTLTYTAAQDFQGNQSSYTTPNLVIGDADPDRWVIAAIAGNFNTARSLTGVTIGGVGATFIHASNTLTTEGARFEYWKAAVPLGTSAAVVIPATSGLIWSGIVGLWVTQAEPFLFDFGYQSTFSGLTISTEVDVAEGGAVLTMSNAAAGLSRTITAISGADLKFTSLPRPLAGASSDELAAETARAISMTWNTVGADTRFHGLSAVSITFNP